MCFGDDLFSLGLPTYNASRNLKFGLNLVSIYNLFQIVEHNT